MGRALRSLTLGGRRTPGIAVAAGIIVFAASPATSAAAPPDAAEGKRVFGAHCAVCHSIKPEFHKEGPSLAGVYGRRAGTAPFFPHYQALKGSNVVWTDETLDAWLADPRGFAGGRSTGMTLKLTDPNARASVIAYLKTLR
jgi:cytochrome c